MIRAICGQQLLSVYTVLELALIFDGVEVAFRFCDESVVIDLPKFVAANPNAFFPFVSLKRNIDRI